MNPIVEDSLGTFLLISPPGHPSAKAVMRQIQQARNLQTLQELLDSASSSQILSPLHLTAIMNRLPKIVLYLLSSAPVETREDSDMMDPAEGARPAAAAGGGGRSAAGGAGEAGRGAGGQGTGAGVSELQPALAAAEISSTFPLPSAVQGQIEQLVQRVRREAVAQAEALDAQAVANMLLACAKLGYKEAGFIEELLLLAVEKMEEFNGQNLAMVLNALVGLGWRYGGPGERGGGRDVVWRQGMGNPGPHWFYC